MWVAKCGLGNEARSTLLDVALIEAIRHDFEVVGQGLESDYAEWTRLQADRIERDVAGPA